MNIQGISSVKCYLASEVNFPIIFTHNTYNVSQYSSESPDSLNFIPGSCSMKTSEKVKDAGNLTKIEISYKIAGNDPDDLLVLDDHTRLKFIYVVTDNTGQKYILGHQNNQCATLKYNLKNDSDGKGGRSISVKISLQTFLFPVYASADT